MLVTLSVTQLAGQILFAAGAQATSWDLMLGGRVVFGLGGEVLTVVNNYLVARWFAGSQLGTALAIIVGFGRGCSVLNDGVTPLFADPANAYWLSAGLCGLSSLAALGLAWLDSWRHAEEAEADAEAALADPSGPEAERERAARAGSGGGACGVVTSSLASVASFTPAFWVLSLVFVIGAASVSSYNNVATDYLTFRWGIRQPGANSRQRRGLTLGIIYLVSALVAPGVGVLVDRAGRRWPFMLAGMLVAAGSHALLGIPELWAVPVELVHCLLGAAYALFASCNWSLVPLLVPPGARGTSYGVATAVQNIGLALFPLAVSQLQPGPAVGTGGAVRGLCAHLAGELGRSWAYSCAEWLLLAMAAAAAAGVLVLSLLEVRTVKRMRGKDDGTDLDGTSPLLAVNDTA